jgi:hypothetical protein
MKTSSGILIATSVIASAIGIGPYRWYMPTTVFANNIFANDSLTSEFFKTYDPGPVLMKYGSERERSSGRSSGSGSNEATRARGITAIISLPASQVAGLTAALRNDIDTKLRAQVHLIGSAEDSGEYSYEYETRNAWGFLILERIELEQSSGGDATTWRVRMHLIERCHR